MLLVIIMGALACAYAGYYSVKVIDGIKTNDEKLVFYVFMFVFMLVCVVKFIIIIT